MQSPLPLIGHSPQVRPINQPVCNTIPSPVQPVEQPDRNTIPLLVPIQINDDPLRQMQRPALRPPVPRRPICRCRRCLPDEPSAFNWNGAAVTTFDPGLCNKICDFCCVRHWVDERGSEKDDESFEKCCKRRKVDLPPLWPAPEPLATLFTEQEPRGKDFRHQIRAYNTAFALNSIKYNMDDHIDPQAGGVQCICIQGMIYHYQGLLWMAS